MDSRVDPTAWAALMGALTLVFALGTVWAFRNRGAAAGLRGLAITLLPPAAWLTGTLEMFTEITGSVADWATGLVFNPLVWIGATLFGTSAVLFLIAGRLRGRGLTTSRNDAIPAGSGSRQPDAAGPQDDDMSDIEELLRKRGIN